MELPCKIINYHLVTLLSQSYIISQISKTSLSESVSQRRVDHDRTLWESNPLLTNMLILPLLLEKIWMSSKLVQRVDGWDPANLPEIVLLRCTWPEKPDFFTLLEMLYLPMHFSMGALGGFHIRIKTWPRLIGRDVSNILFPKARRVAADHKNILLIDKESTAPIRCMSKNKQLFAFKQKHQTKYKRCSYFSTFRHLPMGNPRACRNVFL